MIDVDWKEILGWSDEHVSQVRSIGFLYYKQGAYDIAATCFEALLIINPHALYELQTLSAIYIQMHRPQEALTLIDRALSIDPSHEPTLFNRCKALFALGDKNSALDIAALLEKSHDPFIAKTARAYLQSFAATSL